MAEPTTPGAADGDVGRSLDGGFWLVLAMAVVCGVLVVATLVGGGSAPAAGTLSAPTASTESGSPSVDPSAFLVSAPLPAPAIDLTDQDDRPFSLASLQGSPTFVFFGYTHCPDVCPATIGTVGEAMAATDVDARAVFVTIDPARDTTTWLREYARYLPAGFTALTGAEPAIRATADAWGVRYAKVDAAESGAYSMSHTADVHLVDGDGVLRATFPFGTSREAMAATLRVVATDRVAIASPTSASTSAPTPSASGAPASGAPASTPVGLDVEVVSTSVWSGPASPVILRLAAAGAGIDSLAVRPVVQLTSVDGVAVGPAVEAVAVQPPGVPAVSFVAAVAIPSPGPWRLIVTTDLGGRPAEGTADLTALDPGSTAAIGAPAPTVRTPTLDDVGGVARAVTTDPAPDLRLSERSTTDALQAHQPFVLVADSTKFRVSPACGRAIIMARYLLDRWPGVAFIHLEPYRYAVITATPVLEGTLDDPTLTDPAAAWGIGGDPWGPKSMPWTFVVDGQGIVRAKYQGVTGSDDVDVIVSLIAQGG